MFLGAASKRKNTFLLWLLATLPSTLNIAAQPLEAGDVVDVTVVANAFDPRTDDVVGCPPDGCTAENTRDGNLQDISRWSCSRELVAAGGGADGEECRIVYEFSDAIPAVYGVSVAFYRGEERTRTMNVEINGVQVTVIESSGVTSGLETYELNAQDVVSLGLESVGLPEDDDFLSLIEVTFDVSEFGAATSSPFGAATPAPTFSERGVELAPSSPGCGDQTCSNGLPGYEASSVCCPLSCGTCGGDGCSELGEGCCSSVVKTSGELCSETKAAPCNIDGDIFVDGGSSCVDGTASGDSPSGISTRGAWIFVGIVTAVSLFLIRKAQKGGVAVVNHCKLILQAYFFSTAEGIALVLLVPSSKQSLQIGAICFFGFLSALSGLLLRRARRGFRAVVWNTILEALFAVVTLFVFVEKSTQNVLLFGALAGNEALVGIAIFCFARSHEESPESFVAKLSFCVEGCFLVVEALTDAIFPLVWTLLRSLFHPDSAWRSDAVFILWTIIGSANLTLIWTCLLPPFTLLGFGIKALVFGVGFFNGVLGVMSFVLLYMTERNIDDPPTFEVVWSSVWGTLGVLGLLGTLRVWYIGLNELPNDEVLRFDSEDESGENDSEDESGENAL